MYTESSTFNSASSFIYTQYTIIIQSLEE